MAILIIEGNSSVAGNNGAGGITVTMGAFGALERQAVEVYDGGARVLSGLQLVYEIHSYLTELERQRARTAIGPQPSPRTTRTCNRAAATPGRV